MRASLQSPPRRGAEPNATGRELNEEQDVEPLQEQGVDGEEIALEDARRLLAQELRPARLRPLRRRLDLRLLEDRPDSARGELHTETGELALNPSVAPARILAGEPHHERSHLRCCR